MKNRLSKRLLTLIIAAVLVAALAIGGTVAFVVSHNSSLRNDFNAGVPAVEIVEPGVDPDNVECGVNSKPVILTIPGNQNAVAGVVRVNISPYAYTPGGDGSQILFPGMSRPVRNQIVMGDITLHFDSLWSDHWFYKDGYFYYNKVLQPGETTSLLLTGVTLTEDTLAMQTKYESLKVDLRVTADVLQAGGGAPAQWGLTVNGDNVSVITADN